MLTCDRLDLQKLGISTGGYDQKISPITAHDVLPKYNMPRQHDL